MKFYLAAEAGNSPLAPIGQRLPTTRRAQNFTLNRRVKFDHNPRFYSFIRTLYEKRTRNIEGNSW